MLNVPKNIYIKCLEKGDHMDLYLNPLKYLVGSTFLYGNRDRCLKFYLRSSYIAKLRLRTPINHIIHNMVLKSRVKLEFLFKRVGGAYYNIPSFLDPKREISHTIKNMILLINQSSTYDRFGDKFSGELLNFYRRRGLFLQHRRRSHQLAIVNRPYTNYLQRTDRRVFRKSFSKYKQYCMFYRTAFQSYLNTLDEEMYLREEEIVATKLSRTPLHNVSLSIRDTRWYKKIFGKKVSFLIANFLSSYNNISVKNTKILTHKNKRTQKIKFHNIFKLRHKVDIKNKGKFMNKNIINIKRNQRQDKMKTSVNRSKMKTMKINKSKILDSNINMKRRNQRQDKFKINVNNLNTKEFKNKFANINLTNKAEIPVKKRRRGRRGRKSNSKKQI